MKQGWEYKKLGEIGTIVTGNTPSTKKEEYYSSNDYCFIKPSDLPAEGYEILKDSEYHISSKGYEVSRKLPKGSVLVSCIGIIGKTAILGVDACSNQQINSIIPKEDVNNKFLAYSILSQRYKLKAIANAPVVPLINKGDFSKIQIPLPPLSVQQSIVAELDEINDLLSLKRKELETYDKLAQSLFYEMFGDPVENEKGWEKKRLGEVCSEIKYGTSKPACDNGKYKYLRMCNLSYDGYLDLADIKRIDVSDEEIEKCIVRYGDILFNRTNSHELIGKTCMFDQQEPMVIAGYIIRVRLTKELMPQVLARMFNLASIKKLLRSMAKGAVNQANINSKELASIQIPIPSFDLQQLFATRIEAIEAQKTQVKVAIEKLETLLAARMQYWFE